MEVRHLTEDWNKYNSSNIVCNCFADGAEPTWDAILSRVVSSERPYIEAVRKYLFDTYDKIPKELAEKLSGQLVVFSDGNAAFFTKARWTQFITAHNNSMGDF